jgi:alkylation response protein AidB-like acyl-CoA dehydrogenase
MQQIVWVQEAALYDLPLDIFNIGIGMAGPTILSWGTPEQKDRWLPPMLRGEEIWCQLFSEPNAGSDVAAVQTRAVRDGDEWVVDGQKVWTSGAQFSKWGMLLARTDPDAPKHNGLSYFGIDMDQSGVEVRPLRQMTGGASFNEVYLSEARVPNDALIGGPGMGWSVALTTLMNERTSIGAVGGLAGSSGSDALARLLDEVARATGLQPVTGPTRDQLADLTIRTMVLQQHAGRIIAKLAQGQIPTAEGSAAKLLLSGLLERLANFAVEVQGPRGMLLGDDALAGGTWGLAFLGYPGVKIAGGSDEIMRNIIGERVLDLPREPK